MVTMVPEGKREERKKMVIMVELEKAAMRRKGRGRVGGLRVL